MHGLLEGFAAVAALPEPAAAAVAKQNNQQQIYNPYARKNTTNGLRHLAAITPAADKENKLKRMAIVIKNNPNHAGLYSADEAKKSWRQPKINKNMNAAAITK